MLTDVIVIVFLESLVNSLYEPWLACFGNKFRKTKVSVHGACLLILMAVQKPQRKTIKRYIRDCSLAQEAQEEELRHVSTAIDA